MTRPGWMVAKERRKHGNPTQAPLRAGPPAFEVKLKELGLAMDETCLTDAELVRWIKHVHDRVYIPEEVLERLGLAQRDAYFSFGVGFRGHRNLTSGNAPGGNGQSG